MVLHNLKIEEKYIYYIFEGIKSFELRKNDRDFKVGDLIHFVKTDNTEIGVYNQRNLFKIIYVLKDVEKYGLNKDYCILGIRRID